MLLTSLDRIRGYPHVTDSLGHDQSQLLAVLQTRLCV